MIGGFLIVLGLFVSHLLFFAVGFCKGRWGTVDPFSDDKRVTRPHPKWWSAKPPNS